MNRFIVVLRWVGTVFVLFAVVQGGRILFTLITETRLHKRVGVMPVSLSAASDWSEAAFRLHRPGVHTLYLTTVNAFTDSIGTKQPQYRGVFDVALLTPHGESFLNKRYSGASLPLLRPHNMEWTVLEELPIDNPFDSEWTIRVRVVEPDTAFAATRSQILIFPPQKFEIGWFIFEKSVELAVMSLLFFLGMGAVGAGALLRRRQRTA